MKYSLALSLLALASADDCTGPAGPQGEPGPAGAPAPPYQLATYVLQERQPLPAVLECRRPSDVVISGGCVWLGDVAASETRPATMDGDAAPFGWLCEGVGAGSDEAIVYVVCAVGEPSQ